MSNSTMPWLPPAGEFQSILSAALACANREERLGQLAFVAQHNLDYLQTIKLDRALSGISNEATNFPSVKIALLSSGTVDHLLPAIRVGGLRHRYLTKLYAGGYGQYRQELLNDDSKLREFAPQIVVLSLMPANMIGGIAISANAQEADAALGQQIEELRVLWRKARTDFGATVIQQTFLNTAHPVFGNLDRLMPGAPSQLISHLNAKLAEAAASDGVLLLDIARESERAGLENWFDAARWLQGKFEISPKMAPRYGEIVSRVVAAARGMSRKCLVLDLDNTLWGGVVGDDGLNGIVLGEGSAVGEAHLSLQHYARQLKDRGVILAVCSKNETSVAEAVFREHPEMLLRRSDIAAFVANWNDKAENLKTIAKQLNIGIDSLVFVDDNPAERARIRSSLPMVAVPELPDDPAYYAERLADAGYFEAATFTAEDRERTAQYVANSEREAMLETSESIDDFLRGLKMVASVESFARVDYARITQLINKTNQFNPTTRRMTAEEVTHFVSSPDVLTLQCRLADRFGDNGLVSAMIAVPQRDDPHVLEIICWVMSCRVFGRQLEAELMNAAVETARTHGVLQFRAQYIPTAKNTPVRDLYPKLGFTALSDAGLAGGSTGWTLHLADYAETRTHITRARAHYDRKSDPRPLHASPAGPASG
jgi:FkbH-like protein